MVAERAAWARKGGHGRSNARRAAKALGDGNDLLAVQTRLVVALQRVEDGTLDPPRAQAMAALARAIGALAVPGELAQRVADLERVAGGRPA